MTGSSEETCPLRHPGNSADSSRRMVVERGLASGMVPRPLAGACRRRYGAIFPPLRSPSSQRPGQACVCWSRGLAALASSPSSQLALLFLYHSIVAGVDVARRALDPRLPLHPGFVAYPTRLSRGVRRNVFTTLTSLLPGTVPTGQEDDLILYHCLDVGQPVVEELAAEEAALVRALYND